LERDKGILSLTLLRNQTLPDSGSAGLGSFRGIDKALNFIILPLPDEKIKDGVFCYNYKLEIIARVENSPALERLASHNKPG